MIYAAATSLDGFIADGHGNLDWLFGHLIDPDGPGGFGEIDARAGALLMGRMTSDWVAADPQCGRAKGIVMSTLRCSGDQAFRLLRERSRHENHTMVDRPARHAICVEPREARVDPDACRTRGG